MTIDHTSLFLFHNRYPLAFKLGRLAFPLFAFVFAYNVARLQKQSQYRMGRIMRRLIVFGLLATPTYMMMFNYQIRTLNILFTFALSLMCMQLLNKPQVSRWQAVILILFGGFAVEYLWFGVLFCLACWYLCVARTTISLILYLLSYYFLDAINGNHWALLSVPILLLSTMVKIPMPRVRHIFYYYYPLHLSTLALIKIFDRVNVLYP